MGELYLTQLGSLTVNLSVFRTRMALLRCDSKRSSLMTRHLCGGAIGGRGMRELSGSQRDDFSCLAVAASVAPGTDCVVGEVSVGLI
jgi:hypothetical protein